MPGNAEGLSLDIGHTIGHTNGMKIAISIPGDVFQAVKKVAEEKKQSRSEVIVEALTQYLAKLESRRIFDALNEAYAAPDMNEDKEARTAALDLYRRTVLKREEW
jgi:metal-responsive CopG/Arc/MetJ family transcriptional regulator